MTRATRLYGGMNDSLSSRFKATEAKVSKKLYAVELRADEPKHVTQVGVGSVICSLTKKANQAACKATFW